MRTFALCFAAILVVGPCATTVKAEEENVAVANLPVKVVTAIKAKFPAANLVSAVKDKEDGQTMYEVKITVTTQESQVVASRRRIFRSRPTTSLVAKTQEIEVGLNEDGTIYEMEKTIEAKDLPKAVSDTLASKYGTAAVDKIEEIYKKDKLVHYEFKLTSSAKKKFEVEIAADGKFLVEETAKDKKLTSRVKD